MQFDTRSLWIYLHFTQLQLDVLEHELDESPSTSQYKLHSAEPRAIYEVQQNRIAQINSAAQKRGIKEGMGLASASLLYPDLSLHEYKPEVESTTLEHLANALYLITSDIVLEAPKGLILRAQNMLHLYGGLQPYWQSIQDCIHPHRLHYQSACAFSIQAAKLMAKQGLGVISQERKLIQTQLEKCQLDHSDIHPKDLEKLKRIGVHTMAELNRIPLSDIANRCSRYSVDIISELRGEAPSKVSFFKPLKYFKSYIELLYDISLSEKLLPVLSHALNKLSQFLYVRNARCLHIDLDFYQREHQAMRIGFDSAMPIYRTDDWLSIIRLKLEQVRFDSAVYAISLYCDKYEAAHLANDDFFARKSTHLAAMSLLSRLASKLGHHRSGRSKLNTLKFVADFRPEVSTQSTAHTAGKRHHDTQSIFADRPGLLLPKPIVLEKKVRVIKGPERIVSAWWDDEQGQSICRDYYIAQSEQGQQIWVFKTPEQKWYLHGYFI